MSDEVTKIWQRLHSRVVEVCAERYPPSHPVRTDEMIDVALLAVAEELEAIRAVTHGSTEGATDQVIKVDSIEGFTDSFSSEHGATEVRGTMECWLSNKRLVRVQWGEPYNDGRGDPGVSLDGSECIEIFDKELSDPEGILRGAAPSETWPGSVEYPALLSELERAAIEQTIDDRRMTIKGDE